MGGWRGSGKENRGRPVVVNCWDVLGVSRQGGWPV